MEVTERAQELRLQNREINRKVDARHSLKRLLLKYCERVRTEIM